MPVLRSECGAAAESKAENIREIKWRPADRRTGGRAKRIKTRKVKQEGVSIIGTEFHQEPGRLGANVDRSRCWSGEVRNSSMER